MSDSESNNHNSYFKSSFNTFSKVCKTDPQNMNQQICKETVNENGKIKEKEYIIPLNSKFIYNNNYNYNNSRNQNSSNNISNNIDTSNYLDSNDKKNKIKNNTIDENNHGFFNHLKNAISNAFTGNKNKENKENKYDFYEENHRKVNNSNFNRALNDVPFRNNHHSDLNNFPNFSNTRDAFFSDIDDFFKFESKIFNNIR